MHLRQMMKHDAAAFLSLNELGERSTYLASGAAAANQITVRFIAQPERQTIRRAFIWTRAADILPAFGGLFTINRGHDVLRYRLMYSDAAETSLQRHVCHEQITTSVQIVDRERYKTKRGADGWSNSEAATVAAKVVLEAGEPVRQNNRRRMRGEYNVYFEELPALNTDQVVIDSSGRAYLIRQIERPVDRIDLPYAIVSRIDV